MKSRISIAVMGSILVGCAALNQDAGWERVNRAMTSMGSGDAIARLGIPTSERYVSGNKVLSWRDSESGGQLYCDYTAMYSSGDKYLRSNLEGQNGPCYNWLVRRGFSD